MLVSIVVIISLASLISQPICIMPGGVGGGREAQYAREIFLGLKLYEGDYDTFPNQTAEGKPLENSNQAFRPLFPNYVPAKNYFYSKSSHWTPHPPSKQTSEGITPAAGENHFAYLPNLSGTSNPRIPIIATGFSRGQPGVYSIEDESKKPNGRQFKVVVVRLDGSATMETVSKENYRVYNDDINSERFDIFAPTPGWLQPNQAPLNPEG